MKIWRLYPRKQSRRKRIDTLNEHIEHHQGPLGRSSGRLKSCPELSKKGVDIHRHRKKGDEHLKKLNVLATRLGESLE